MNASTDRVYAAMRAVLPLSAVVGAPMARGRDVEVDVSGIAVRARWVARGYPREVADSLAHLPLPDLIVAPSMSPGARAACAEVGVGWISEDGGAEVAKGLLVVSRTASPMPSDAVPRGWTMSTVAVSEALLTRTPPTVSATADATGLSQKSTTQALRFLEDLGLLDSRARRGPMSARRVADVRALLDGYAAAVSQISAGAPSLQVGVLWRDEIAEAGALGRRWDDAGRAWAVTGALGAAAIAPFGTSIAPLVILVDARTPADLQLAAREAQLSPVDGGRLTLRGVSSPSTLGMATRLDGGLSCAPWPRIYADIRGVGVRGEDVAENLFEQVVRLGKAPS